MPIQDSFFRVGGELFKFVFLYFFVMSRSVSAVVLIVLCPSRFDTKSSLTPASQ